jgi:hypothetical protein
MNNDALTLWTVYERPKDFPESYVARMWEVTALGPQATQTLVEGDLEFVRAAMRAMGLVKLLRADGDDPVILETWM